MVFLLPSSGKQEPQVSRTSQKQTENKAHLPAAAFAFAALGAAFGTVLYPLSTNMSSLLAAEGLGNAATAAFIVTLYTVGTVLGGSIYSTVAKGCKRMTLSLSFVMVAVGLFLTYVSHNVPLLTFASALVGLGAGIYLPDIYMLVGKACPASVRALGMSLFMTAIHIGFFFSPYFNTALCTVTNTDALRFPFLFGTFFYMAIAIGFLPVFSKKGADSQGKEVNH